MKKLIFLFIITPIYLFTSCTNDKIDSEISYSQIIDLTMPIDFDDLYEEFGIYSYKIKNTTNGAVILSNVEKPNFVNGNSSFTPRNAVYCSESDQDFEIIQDGEYEINSKIFKYIGTNRYQCDEIPGQDEMIDFISNELLGKEVSVNYKEGEVSQLDETIYAPMQFNFVGLNDGMQERNYIRLNKNNFELNYNSDINNQNGIYISFSYRGLRADMTLDDFEQSSNDEFIRRAILIKSEHADGRLRLPSQFFADIPTNGIVNLNIVRQGGLVTEVNGKKFSFTFGSEYTFDVVVE